MFCVSVAIAQGAERETSRKIIRVPIDAVSFPRKTGFIRTKVFPAYERELYESVLEKVNSLAGVKKCGIHFFLNSFQAFPFPEASGNRDKKLTSIGMEIQELRRAGKVTWGKVLTLGNLSHRVAGGALGVTNAWERISSSLVISETTVAHELFHLFHLDHVRLNSNLMHPLNSSSHVELEEGQCLDARYFLGADD